jgi:uncharacterized protein YdaU (DUF1376 family)
VSERMRAEWFWCDRWIASSAFLLPMEARGLYREMLTAAWLRGARLPADPEAIRRAVGCSEMEWGRSWPLIRRYWSEAEGFIVNATQVEVYAECQSQRLAATSRGRKGGLASAEARSKTNTSSTQVGTQVEHKLNPLDLDLDLTQAQTPQDPLTPAVAGAEFKFRPITRPERTWANQALRDNGGRCPHREPNGRDECATRIFCIGRLVSEHRAEEKRGQKAGIA